MAEVVIATGEEGQKPPFTLEEALGMVAASPEFQTSEERHGVPGLLRSALDKIEDDKKRGDLNG